MASRFVNPFPQYLDSTPEVRAGAKLFFYEAGTSTKLHTYSDRTLSTANTNPVVLNSAGFPAVDIYLQDLDYKVVLAPSTDTDPPASAIWSADYVRGRDSALIAKTVTGSGSPNGSVAGTAGSASILPDFYWDYTNSILYVCTTTGTSSTAVWTAINASSATAAVPSPQGRLTPTSGSPVITGDASAVTTVYYEPFVGNLVPIYNGTSMVPTEFAALSLLLVSQHAASTLYDVFVFSNSGVVTVATGPAWTSSTAGSCSRGTGGSTTQLARVEGLWVNAVSMSARNGTTTYTIGANLGTYVGSIFIDGSAGTVSCHVSYGQSRKWGVWNAYNRVPVLMKMGDSTASWGTAPTTWRQSRADANNFIHLFAGLAEEPYDLHFTQNVRMAVSANNSTSEIGIGYNSTTALSGKKGSGYFESQVAATVLVSGGTLVATHMAPPAIGINKINSIEQAPSGTTNNSFIGTSDSMIMTAKWRA
jgi:hypothetical protein